MVHQQKWKKKLIFGEREAGLTVGEGLVDGGESLELAFDGALFLGVEPDLSPVIVFEQNKTIGKHKNVHEF